MIALASDIDALPETMLSPSSMVPDMRSIYRRRTDGRLASVSAWMPTRGQMVLEYFEYRGVKSKRVTMPIRQFWDEWVYNAIYDPTRN